MFTSLKSLVLCQGSLGDTAQLFRMTAEAALEGDTFKESFRKKQHPVGWILGKEKSKKYFFFHLWPFFWIYFILRHTYLYLSPTPYSIWCFNHTAFGASTILPGQATGSPGICERTQWHCGFCRISFPYLSNSYGLPFSLQQAVVKGVCAIEFISNLRMR